MTKEEIDKLRCKECGSVFCESVWPKNITKASKPKSELIKKLRQAKNKLLDKLIYYASYKWR